jgi:aryl-alcohol dehydrogenase-like predicted oxidoreductase
MSLNHYLSLGRSGLRVSPLCLGTMTFGLDWGWGSDPPTSHAILDRYISLGGNFLDTANIYTKGHSEKIIGDYLANHPSVRQQLVIATKFMGNLFPGDPNAGGGGRKNVIASCDESLRRLRSDYIDLYWMHWRDPHTPIDETLRAMDDLVRTGKVRYLGFSDTPAWMCVQAIHEGRLFNASPLIALQIEYSLSERTVEGDLLPMAREFGLGVTPWSPLKGGVLTGKYSRKNAAAADPGRGAWVKNHLTEINFNIIDALIDIAKHLKSTPARVALAWVNNRPGVVSSIIGARTLEQLDDNLAALELKLPAEHLVRLDEVSKPSLAFPHEFLKYTINNTQGGTAINGRPSEPWPLAPKSPSERH